MRNGPLISVVAPALNEAECLPQLHKELALVCDPLPFDFEFIFVNDGSSDETEAVLAEMAGRDSRVRCLTLSRPFGQQAALHAGLAHASGDAVITMDADLQHPPELIPQLIERWRDGVEVVSTVRTSTKRIGLVKRTCTALFFRVFRRLTNIQLEPGVSEYRLLSRRATDLIIQLPERARFLRGLIPWLGLKEARVEFVAPERFAGKTKYSVASNIPLALQAISGFTLYPLRRMAVLGWTVMSLAVLYAGVAIAYRLISQNPVPGWTSVMVSILFIGGCQIVMLSILGEYIGRILEQVKARPEYVVREAVGFESSDRSARGYRDTLTGPQGERMHNDPAPSDHIPR